MVFEQLVTQTEVLVTRALALLASAEAPTQAGGARGRKAGKAAAPQLGEASEQEVSAHTQLCLHALFDALRCVSYGSASMICASSRPPPQSPCHTRRWTL